MVSGRGDHWEGTGDVFLSRSNVKCNHRTSVTGRTFVPLLTQGGEERKRKGYSS